MIELILKDMNLSVKLCVKNTYVAFRRCEQKTGQQLRRDHLAYFEQRVGMSVGKIIASTERESDMSSTC